MEISCVFSPKMSSLLLPSFRILAIAASIILVPRSDAGYAASFTTQSPVAPLRIRREALLSSSAHVSKQRALIRSCLKELRGGAGDGVDASSTRSEESDYGDHIVSPVAAIAASSTESEDSIENSANPGLARAKRKRGDAISASLSRKDALKRAAAEQGYAALSSSERDSSLDEIGPGSPEARSTPVEGTLGALAAEEQVSKRARVDLIRQDGTRGSIAASKHSSGKRIESDNEYRDVRSNRCKDYAETGICPYGDRCIYAHDRSEFLRAYKRRSTARLAALKDQGAKPKHKHHRAEFAWRPRGRRARGLPLPG